MLWIRSAVLIQFTCFSYTIVLAAGGAAAFSNRGRMHKRPQQYKAAGGYGCGTSDSRADSQVEQAIAEQIARQTTASQLLSVNAAAADGDDEQRSGIGAVGKKSTVQIRWHCIQVNDTYEGGHLDRSRIQAQINVLNEVYAASSMPFHFKLASIDYTQNVFWFHNNGPGSLEDVAMRQGLRKGGIADLNIYSVGSIIVEGEEFFGFSAFPWDLPANSSDPSLFKDGIVLEFMALPGGRPNLNKGLALAHEVFHTFGGYHIWNGGCDPTTGGDQVSDTNPQASRNFGCPIGRHSCSTEYTDMVSNFMDYTDQWCGTKHFTPGQVARATAFATLFRGIGGDVTTFKVPHRKESGKGKRP